MVGLLSAANCIGRLSSGMLSDVLVARHGIPRAAVLVVWMGATLGSNPYAHPADDLSASWLRPAHRFAHMDR